MGPTIWSVPARLNAVWLTEPSKRETKMPKNTPVVMESRKFLGAINGGLQAKITVMEGRVREMGRQASANWRLVSLSGDHLFIEDVDTNTFYVADHKREKGNTLTIDNVRPLQIIESKKKSVFEASCRQLIDAIEENDQRGMNAAFNKLAGQKFTARTVPTTGIVRTFDGVTRHINVASDDTILDESIRPRLVSAIVAGLTDQVTLHEGVPVSGTFASGRIKLPVTEWTCRKAVARHMRTVAENAYYSPGFQNRVHEVAQHIYNDKIEEAIKTVSGFLAEQQEFTTLNRAQTRRLVENALAAKAIFNDQLCKDTATLFWRTNLKVNKDAILKEWAVTAKKAAHTTLLENVRILESVKDTNFEGAYEKFINLVFNEAVGPRDVQVGAYKTALVALKETPKIRESGDLSGKIDELIERLEQSEQDHAVIAEVEDLLAEVKNEMNALETMDSFDQMPGSKEGNEPPLGSGMGGDDMGMGGEEGGKQTVVNFNINIGKDGVDVGGMGDKGGGDEGGGDEDLDAMLAGGGGDEGGGDEGGGDDLDSLLAGGGEEEEEEEGGEDDLAALLKGESVENHGRDAINEDDPYHFAGTAKAGGGLGSDYGTNPIEIAEDCMKAVRAMLRIAEHNDLTGNSLVERAPELAAHGIKAAGIMVPERRRDQAVEQVCSAFFDELDRLGLGLDEDQFKGPWRHVWGRKKAAINRREAKKTASESARKRSQAVNEDMAGCSDDNSCDTPMAAKSQVPQRKKRGAPKVEWVEEQDTGKKGYFGGVGFVFDHGGDSPIEPAILSEDGEVVVDIPRELTESAFAAADMALGDPQPFLRWLANNIEQLRPLNEGDNGLQGDIDDAIQESQVRITTSPDGGIQVEVDSEDPNVAMTEPGMDDDPMGDGMGGDPIDGMGDEMGMPDDGGPAGDADVTGMEPVDSLPPDMEGGGEIGDIGGDGEIGADVPDFEGEGGGPPSELTDEGGDEGGGDEGGAPPPPPKKKGPPSSGDKGPPKKGPPAPKKGKDDEGVAEDRDITDPKSKKYNTTKQDHRKEATATKPGKADGKLDGFGEGETETPGVEMKKVTPKGGGKSSK